MVGLVRDLRAVDASKPFFMYFCTGACHSPHQAPPEWIARYRGRFDVGWDGWREATLARQIAAGLLPPGTALSPRPEWVPAWDTLSADERRLYARYMEAFAGFLSHTDRHLGRLLAFPVPTVAALNGHAFAGGAMFALAHDFRVMREDRGFFCIPEVDLGLPLAPGLLELLRARLPRTVLHEAIVTGRRYGAADALARGLVDEVAEEADVVPRAIALAAELAGKDPVTLAALKRGLHGATLRLLETPAGLAPPG